MTRPPAPGALVAAFLVVYVVWGSTYLGLRYAVATLPPFLVAGTRALTAGTLLFLLVRHRAPRAPTRAEWIGAAQAGAILIALSNGLVTWAEQRVASSLAALVAAGTPIWIAVFEARRTGEPVPPVRLAGLALGLAGLVLLVWPEQGHFGQVHLPSVLAVLLASLCWAWGTVTLPDRTLPADKLLSAAMQMITAGALSCGAGLLLGEGVRFDPARVSAASVAAWGYLVVFGSMLAYPCYIWLAGQVTASAIGTTSYVNPLVAVVLGWAVAHERITPRTLGAAALILLGVGVVFASRRAVAARAAAG